MPSDLPGLRFVRSSFCVNGSCVEVAQAKNGEVRVRDSKDNAGPHLVFTADEWRDFLRGARAGEFD